MGLLVHFTDLSTLSIILFVVGIILLVIEMTIPGFGLAGISGVILLIIDVIITAKTLVQGLWLAFAIFIVIILLFIIFLILASHGKLPKKIILKEEAKSTNGFMSSKNNQSLLNQKGVTISELHPAGIAVFDSVRHDVVSNGEFIEKNKNIIVMDVVGSRIVVKEIKEV